MGIINYHINYVTTLCCDNPTESQTVQIMTGHNGGQYNCGHQAGQFLIQTNEQVKDIKSEQINDNARLDN